MQMREKRFHLMTVSYTLNETVEYVDIAANSLKETTGFNLF